MGVEDAAVRELAEALNERDRDLAHPDDADGGVGEVDAVGVPREVPVVLGEAHPHLVEPGEGVMVELIGFGVGQVIGFGFQGVGGLGGQGVGVWVEGLGCRL